MAFCRLVFPLLVLSIIQIYAVEVPVFIWGDVPKSNYKSNPLSTVTKEDFQQILDAQLQKDDFTVIFIEETLSVDDFSHKNVDGEISFPYLHQHLGHSVYVPSVSDPLDVFNDFVDPEKADHVKLTEDGVNLENVPESAKFLFITLKDAKDSETRSDLLRRHNDFMEDIYVKLQDQYKNVVGIYTARNPSWTIPTTHSRVRRDTNETVAGGSDHRLDGLHIYVVDIKLAHSNATTSLSGLTSSTSQFGEGNMTTTLNYPDASLTLRFIEERGYWFFDTVTLQVPNEAAEELFLRSDDVYALLGFSYRCGQEVIFASVNETKSYKLTFEDLEIQPFFGTVNSTDFGDSFNCVGFFSVPIWSGLFVVFILLSITFFGIMMMLDIRTMDRFDDPKGKTITINAGE